MKILIILNQTINANPTYDHDYIIGVDGGCRWCMDHNLPIDLAIGDFDSLDSSDYQRLKQRCVAIERFPCEKDFTDFELAIKAAMAKRPNQITIYGVWGGQWDHCFNNLFCLAAQTKNVPILMPGNNQNGYLLKNKQKIILETQHQNSVSIISITETCTGLTSYGLKYPLDSTTLQFGVGKGLSNLTTENQAHISLTQGVLLIFTNENIVVSVTTSI